MEKKYFNKISLLLLSAILGVFLAFQMRQDIEDYNLVSIQSIHVMKNEVKNNQKEISNIKELIESKEAELSNYEKAISEKGSISDILESELESIKLVANMTDVQGPGIYIRMEDNNGDFIEGQNLNYDVIHDMDVLNIINDLKAAGAEAISINGKRLLADSEVRCGGPIITINGEEVGAPFVIKAIGEPKVLQAAINAPNTYGRMLKDVYNIKIETQPSDNIQIPKYLGTPTFNYLKIDKEEGE